jgi:hypothetical protein
MEGFENLYLEQEQLITDKVPEIKHVDLWAEQISFLAEEHPFKAPAVFFAYRSGSMEDIGVKIQKINLQVDVYYYFETFADTARSSNKQAKALDFLKLLSKINACFHGASGTYFKEMRRIAFAPVETGTAGLLYVQRYECYMFDEAAKVLSEHRLVNDVDVERVPELIVAPEEPMIDME